MYFQINDKGKILVCAETQVFSKLIKLEPPSEFSVEEMENWKIINNEFIYSPIEKVPIPTAFDILEAQVTYTAMMTNTLLEA